MSNSLKNLIRFVLFIIIVVFLMLFLGNLFIPRAKVGKKQGQLYTMKGFYDLNKNSLDVLFIGSSSIYKSISPMEIWDEYGVSSYDYTIPSTRIYMEYYFLKDALRSQKPKVVFLDINTAFYKKKETEPARRKSFDYMNFSPVKVEMLNDDIFDYTFEDKVSILFPLLRYHDRFTRPNVYYYFEDYHSITKGFVLDKDYNPINKKFSYMHKEISESVIPDDISKYLLKIVDLCKKNDIDLVLTALPDARSWNNNHSNTFKNFASENGVKFLELNVEDYDLDWDKDTGDQGIHTNVKGALKTSKYVGKYINDNYNFESHKNDKNYQSWNDDMIEYKKLVKEANKILNKKIKNNKIDKMPGR